MIHIEDDVVPEGWVLKSYSQGMTQTREIFYEWTITNGDETFVARYQLSEIEYVELSTHRDFSRRISKAVRYQFANMVDPGRIDRVIEETKKELGLNG